jgi:hypothetical protein
MLCRIAIGLLLALAIGGCAQPARLLASDGARFTIEGMLVAAPSGPGWWIVEHDRRKVVFSRPTPGSPAALTAWVRSVPGAKPGGSYASLHAMVVGMTDQLDRQRFALKAHVVEPLDIVETVCVRRTMRLDDHQPSRLARGEPGARETPVLSLQLIDILCRHPRRNDAVYAIHFSEREEPARLTDRAVQLAEKFFGALRFVPHTDGDAYGP